jgi:hypothetical protein
MRTKQLTSLFTALTTIACGSLLSGCADLMQPLKTALGGEPAAQRSVEPLASGVITVSRQIPAAEAAADIPALGFLPGEARSVATAAGKPLTLVLNRGKGTVSLLSGEQVVTTVKGEGLDLLAPGSYEVVHKQRNPLWYAPDSYFTARHLPTPTTHDRERFRKGALGEFALFLDKDTAIHAGPIFTNEVGGVRLAEDAIAQLYYRIPVGTTIQVR